MVKKRSIKLLHLIPPIALLLMGVILFGTNKFPVFFSSLEKIQNVNTASAGSAIPRVEKCKGKVCVIKEYSLNSEELRVTTRMTTNNSKIGVSIVANTGQDQLMIGIRNREKGNFVFSSLSTETPPSTSALYISEILFKTAGEYDLFLCQKTQLEIYCDYNKTKSVKVFKGNSISELKPLYPKHNKTNANRINFIFVGSGYKSKDDFVKISKQLLGFNGNFIEAIIYRNDNKTYDPPIVYRDAGLFAIEPLKSNKDKFNFWYLDFDVKEFPLSTNEFSELNFIGLDNMFISLLVNQDPNIPSQSGSFGGGIQAIYDLRPGMKFDSLNNKRIGASQSIVTAAANASNNIEVLSGFEYVNGDIITFANGLFNHESAHGLFSLMHESECVSGGVYPNCASSLEEAESYWGNLIGAVDPFYYELSAFFNKPSPVANATMFYVPMVADDVRTSYTKNDDGTYGPSRKSSIMRIQKSPIFGSVSRARVEQVLGAFTGK